MADEFEEVMRNAARAPGADEAARVRCPDCTAVLAEFQWGITRYRCVKCKWEGIITRHGPAGEQQVQTLRPGKPRPGRKGRKEG